MYYSLSQIKTYHSSPSMLDKHRNIALQKTAFRTNGCRYCEQGKPYPGGKEVKQNKKGSFISLIKEKMNSFQPQMGLNSHTWSCILGFSAQHEASDMEYCICKIGLTPSYPNSSPCPSPTLECLHPPTTSPQKPILPATWSSFLAQHQQEMAVPTLGIHQF